jgi:hypothetical protein
MSNSPKFDKIAIEYNTVKVHTLLRLLGLSPLDGITSCSLDQQLRLWFIPYVVMLWEIENEVESGDVRRERGTSTSFLRWSATETCQVWRRGSRSGSASALAGRGRRQAREKQSETGADTRAGHRSASPTADGRWKLEAAEGRRTHAVYLPRRDRGRWYFGSVSEPEKDEAVSLRDGSG